MYGLSHLSLQKNLYAFVTTDELIQLEFEPDNSTLVVQAIAAGVSVVLMMLLGIWATCRKNGYSDDLQKV
ncbi:unnamed protein product [Haemonchus placei]|uniref:Translocon-associated protein subunit alpha n=1 Tax=Haemonchus placei TaxID=6290 RepID=A0A0N4VYG8_HAEPC|nr:unnamed protein product [Haemonchus placei]